MGAVTRTYVRYPNPLEGGVRFIPFRKPLRSVIKLLRGGQKLVVVLLNYVSLPKCFSTGHTRSSSLPKRVYRPHSKYRKAERRSIEIPSGGDVVIRSGNRKVVDSIQPVTVFRSCLFSVSGLGVCSSGMGMN